jgi:hypothetical protein
MERRKRRRSRAEVAENAEGRRSSSRRRNIRWGLHGLKDYMD